MDVNSIRVLLTFLGLIHIVAERPLGYTPPDIPEKKISTDVPNDLREHIEKLYSLDASVRLIAAERLKKMGERAIPAIPFLIELLGDDTRLFGGWKGASPGVEAAEALGNIGSLAVKPLIAVLKHENHTRRKNATRALVWIDVDAVEQLVAALKNKNPNVRAQAAIALGEIKDRRAVKHLISIAKDPDAFVRSNVIRALG